VTSIAYAERERMWAAASGGRILVPTRSLPDTVDIPRPFAPASRDWINGLFSNYEHFVSAAAEATTNVDEAAACVQAPSRVLTAARAAGNAAAMAARVVRSTPRPNEPPGCSFVSLPDRSRKS
jgi:hypothetical protein